MKNKIIPFKKNDEEESLIEDISEEEASVLFLLLSKMLETDIALSHIGKSFATEIVSKNISLQNFGLFVHSVERVYILVKGYKEFARNKEPWIRFELIWIFEATPFQARDFYVKTLDGQLVAWFNAVERIWEITTKQLD